MIDDFKNYGNQAWAGYKAHIQVWLLGGLVFSVATPASLMLLGGVLYAGVFMMWVEWFREEKTPDLKSFQDYLPYYLPLTLAFISVAVLVGLGLALFILPGLALGALFLWAVPCVVEERESEFWNGLIDSKDLVLDKAQSGGFPKHLVAFLLVMLAYFIPNAIFIWLPLGGFLVTALFVFPLTTGFLAAFYVDATDDSKVVEE